jgi:hypothetical protein
VVYVDPNSTLRTCPACGLADARNRPTQARFECVSCAVAGLADTIAAEKTSGFEAGAFVDPPYATWSGAGKRADQSVVGQARRAGTVRESNNTAPLAS